MNVVTSLPSHQSSAKRWKLTILNWSQYNPSKEPEFLLKWVDSKDPLNPVDKFEWAPESDVFEQWPPHVFYFWKSIKTPIKNFGFVSHDLPPAQPSDHDPTVDSAIDDLLPFDHPQHLRHKFLPEPPLREYSDVQQKIMEAIQTTIPTQ